ncbi:MAG: class beta-lactamase [Rhizorhabdus sp.]|nr:class beta-lactamase [Rhizorhabdus sp.]
MLCRCRVNPSLSLTLREEKVERRSFLIAAGCALASATSLALARKIAPFGGAALAQGVAELEVASQGRLGIAILDIDSGERFLWRADDRFPMCSTFKFLLGAAILRRVERGQEALDRSVPVTAADLVDNSPMSEKRVGGHATVGELCEATITLSDNAAANLLLPAVGGPAGLTHFIRSLGDGVTRLDRNEPSLNEARPGDPRDTTTPLAMLGLLDRLLLGSGLSPESRGQLTGWMLGTRTADHRLRAGLPAGWRIADKTGAGNGSDNEVGLLWSPAGRPLLVSSYITGSPLSLAETNAIHARLGTLIAAAV